jgi:hypothetical protein
LGAGQPSRHFLLFIALFAIQSADVTRARSAPPRPKVAVTGFDNFRLTR